VAGVGQHVGDDTLEAGGEAGVGKRGLSGSGRRSRCGARTRG
jgi:hypothetical protein